MKTPIVQLNQFIQAIRDAGYGGTAAAVAELVDNSIEAGAKRINIQALPHLDNMGEGPVIVVEDNGSGMTPRVLKTALQFGGSTRFGSRASAGRFGMGLPNSSVSQARRLDVYTWTQKNRTWWSYLDIDDITSGILSEIPPPRRRRRPIEVYDQTGELHGTIVIWTKCDRLSQKRLSTLAKKLREELGRIFRVHIWNGRKIMVNGEEVKPKDPLLLRQGDNLTGATAFGPDLVYDVAGPGKRRKDLSQVTVRFVELPVDQWFSLSNADKRKYGITKNAGVSLLRAGREIDFGWFFMGNKRKENYDDWWRCEIEFKPELDEFFGVTHTKQGINPSEELLSLLQPDLESVAHQLNARVRNQFLKLKEKRVSAAEKRASECETLFEPPPFVQSASEVKADWETPPQSQQDIKAIKELEGLSYRLVQEVSGKKEFFNFVLTRDRLQVSLNSLHPFFVSFYSTISDMQNPVFKTFRNHLDLILLAAARRKLKPPIL